MEEDESNDGFGSKSPSAIDFYDYGELSDEIEEFNDDSPSDDKKSVSPKPMSPQEHLEVANSANSEELLNIADKPRNALVPNRPLASVLPEKYQNVDVKSMCSDYREDGALRFLRIFGGKQSNKPDIWRGVRKRQEQEAKGCISLSESLKECEVEPDEEIKFMQHKERSVSGSTVESSSDLKAINNPWRYNAAQLWYDMLDVPKDADSFDYGFKLKDSDDGTQNDECINDIADDAYLMVSQVHWEDDVIWDGEEVKEEVMKNAHNAGKNAGWIPINADRTLSAFLARCNYASSHSNSTSRIPQPINRYSNTPERKEVAQSMFPEENDKLLYDKWENDVIWDSDAMMRILPPKPVEITDSNIILEIPDDQPPTSEALESAKDPKEKKFRPVKKPEQAAEESSLVDIKQDFFNISNDEYYNPKMTQETALKLNYGGTVLQHSIPAILLRKPYFPTFMTPMKLRHFHRPPLRQYSSGPMSNLGFHGVMSLTESISLAEEERRRESEEFGGGDMFFMRTPEDLSGKDGDLVLFEFSEEYPPLMMQVGMASKIRNFYRRKKQLPGSEDTLPNYKYGEVAFCHTSPFLGTLQPGESLQAYENNLFRAPIYEHAMQGTDFLIVRTRYEYSVREVETIYIVGQQLPLIEVPTPKSEKANNFMRDYLSVYIYRLFWENEDTPRKIKMDTVKKAFPSARDFGMRKRLHMCADFQRTGPNARCWLLKDNFRLPTEEEIRAMVSPEQCCAYYSMLAAEQRLKDAGYGDKFSFGGEGENDSLQNKIDDEVKAAPWNTTQAFLSAIKGKCLLDLSGVADPTGCGEGFSYIKAPHKPQWSKEDNGILNPAKRIVKGTDADLRKLSLTGAKKLLKNFNVSDRQIKSMSRWQIIDVVRTLSTEHAKTGEEGFTKYARGNLNSQAEHFRIYKEESQRIFELQNKTLSSKEVLSTDEDSSSEEELEEWGKTIEDILANKKTAKDLSHETEEAERKELKKMMSSDASNVENQTKVENSSPNLDGKILKIYRTFQDNNGREFERSETVRRTEVIQMYLKICETKDSDFIKRFSLDEEKREEIRRERRRIQDQLRRLKRNELKVQNKEPPRKKRKLETPREALKVKCGACGEMGHMRTNRACKLYPSSPILPSIPVAMTEEQEEAAEMSGLNDINLIKIDETKVILSKQLVKHADEIRRKSLVIKIPKEAVTGSSKKKRSYDEPVVSDYLSTPKAVNRKRVDPLVSISLMFEKLVSELKTLPNTQPFWVPVNLKDAPNYFNIIDKPIDLATMKDKARKQRYNCRADFMQDLQLLVDNSSKYNGAHSFLSITANTMLQHCFKKFSEDEDKLMDLEKAINPLLDTDEVAFSYLLEKIVSDQLKAVHESWPFHKPVEKRTAKGYYDIVKNPMDLDTLIKNCKAHKYKSRSAFLADVELIYLNCLEFNGSASSLTAIAKDIVNACKVSLEMYDEQLRSLELGIENLDNHNQVNNHSPPPKTIKHTVKFKLANHSGLNFNGSIDTDSFVDVESLDTPVKNFNDRDSDRSDYDPIGYKMDESNSCLFSPIIESDSEQRSISASPISSKNQSLLSLNGIHKHESNGFENTSKPYSQFTCDNICDDLLLSESDSDQELETVDELKF